MRSPRVSRWLSYSINLSRYSSSSRTCFFFSRMTFFCSLSFVTGWCSSTSLSSFTISESMAGVNSTGVSFMEFSWAMTSSTCFRRMRILSISFVRFFSTVLRQTKVYLLAFDSILVPSIYSTSRLMKPLSARTRTNCVNTVFISSFTRFRKRLMVIKSGCSLPESQI